MRRAPSSTHAGFTFNPLRYVSLTGALVIIDGSDPEQVTWFKG